MFREGLGSINPIDVCCVFLFVPPSPCPWRPLLHHPGISTTTTTGHVDDKANKLHAIASLRVLLDATKEQAVANGSQGRDPISGSNNEEVIHRQLIGNDDDDDATFYFLLSNRLFVQK